MDIISFNEAATANGRIESFINDPDSTSGVVTVPTTIAAGETITIPAGRMAILPDLQIDGDLVVDGEVFIPNGTSLSKVVEKVPSTDNAIVRFDGITGEIQNSTVLIDDNGNLNITGTGKRITGDFSNATEANKVVFQTNTPNSNTFINSIPNGTATTTAFGSFNNSDINNSSVGYFSTNATSVMVVSSSIGTGTTLPITFWVSSIERMRIDASGNVLVTGSGGLGYGTGSGINVTQLTSKSTPVTANKPCGQIVTSNSALAAGTSVNFYCYNSTYNPYTDNILLALIDPITSYGAYSVEICGSNVTGFFAIKITNKTGSTLSDAIIIRFSIIKGAVS